MIFSLLALESTLMMPQGNKEYNNSKRDCFTLHKKWSFPLRISSVISSDFLWSVRKIKWIFTLLNLRWSLTSKKCWKWSENILLSVSSCSSLCSCLVKYLLQVAQPITARCCFSIPPENIRKPKGFIFFSGCIEKQHRAVMA